MALLKMHDGSRRVVKHERALMIWQVLTGALEPDEEQERAALEVSDVHFDHTLAPDDWIEKHLPQIVNSVLNGWLVDRSGKPTRPATKADMDFAVRWGLWENGPTELVTKQQYQTKLFRRGNAKPSPANH